MCGNFDMLEYAIAGASRGDFLRARPKTTKTTKTA